MELKLILMVAFGLLVVSSFVWAQMVTIGRDTFMGTAAYVIAMTVSGSVLFFFFVTLPLYTSVTDFSVFFPLALAAGPIGVLIAINRPFLICLIFVAFTFFQIVEIYPVLLPLRIPEYLALLVLTGLGWGIFISRSLKPYLTDELKLFLLFFGIVTIGLFFAREPWFASERWLDSYLKIGIMTIAIAWLARTPQDFSLATRFWMLGGLIVAIVAITNKIAGIDLVEGSRVTIGEGHLGDPNDLALVLLLPLGFAIAVLVYREKAFDTFLALLTTPAVITAIIATQSRGGLLGVLAVLSVVGLRWIQSKSLLLIFILTLAAGLFLAADIGARFSTGLHEVAGSALDRSATGRLDAWAAAIQMALDRPIVGVGLGNFALYHFNWDGSGKSAHSIWFQVLAETGIFGLVVFLTLIIACWRQITSIIRTLSDRDAPANMLAMALGLQAALIGYCVSGSFLSQAFNWPLYIYVALIAAVGQYTSFSSHAQKS